MNSDLENSKMNPRGEKVIDHTGVMVSDYMKSKLFYSAAIAAGAKDNGRPGPRPHYHEKYYGAFVLDPDGHNIEVVFHG